MSIITRTTDSLTTEPSFISGYEATFEGANIRHDLVDGSISTTLVQHKPRTGTLDLYYMDRADAWAGVALLLAVDTFTLADVDVPNVDMLFQADNVVPAIEVALPDDGSLWVVRVDFQELPT